MSASRPGIRWWIMLGLAIVIAGYGFLNVGLGSRMYPPELRDALVARPWGIYPHAFFGAVAMLLGPFQLHRGFLANRSRHRAIGKVYLVASLLTGLAGLVMAPFSFGGLVTHLGFGALAIVLLGTTIAGYRAIRARRIGVHREWMIRSYALIYAAVSLRILIPTFLAAGFEFPLAYRIISWLCWVPNLIVAELVIAKTRAGAATWLPALDVGR